MYLGQGNWKKWFVEIKKNFADVIQDKFENCQFFLSLARIFHYKLVKSGFWKIYVFATFRTLYPKQLYIKKIIQQIFINVKLKKKYTVRDVAI